jgi:hypothetical protein
LPRGLAGGIHIKDDAALALAIPQTTNLLHRQLSVNASGSEQATKGFETGAIYR